MITSTGSVEFGPDGIGEVTAQLHLSAASHIRCHHYDGKAPILSIRDRHVAVSISPPEVELVTAEDVATARRLAAELERYIADLQARAEAPAKAAESEAA